MKTLLSLLWLSGAAVPQLLAVGASSSLSLEGIIGLPDQPLAILSRAPAHAGQAPELVLGPGQRDDKIELLQVKPELGWVKARVYPTGMTVKLALKAQTNQLPTSAFSLVLEGARLEPILQIYSQLLGRTLLRWPRLPKVAISLCCSATNQAELALRLERALRDQQIASIPDGKKFLMVVPTPEAAAVRPRSAGAKPGAGGAGSAESWPPGVITFLGAELSQVAPVYANLMGRRLEDTGYAGRGGGAIYLQSQTSLNRDECLYALDTLLAWQGYKIIPIGDDLARLVPAPKPAADPAK